LLGYRLGGSESAEEWAVVLEDLKARGLRTVELIVTDGAGGLEKALEDRFSGVPCSAASCTSHAT
jgi:transposase-like protein